MQIKFTKTDGVHTFSDALNLPDDQEFTDEEIEAMMQQRFNNWVTFINTPVEDSEMIEEPTSEPNPAQE